MKNQTVIVTGGSSGMGKYMAKKFAKEGAKVVITGRDEERLKKVTREINDVSEIDVFPIVMDVRDVTNVEQMVEKTVDHFGTIDQLVNNAAGNFVVNAEDLSVNGWHAVIDIVLNGTFYCSQAVGKYWIDKEIKGSILNIVATYAWDAGVGVVHSAAAKAGVMSLTRTLGVEWGRKYGIRVNGIAPGPIERTGGMEKLMLSEEMYQRTIESVPLKRMGKPEEIANLAYFILSDKASYMNAEIVTLDGGQWLNQYPF